MRKKNLIEIANSSTVQNAHSFFSNFPSFFLEEASSFFSLGVAN